MRYIRPAIFDAFPEVVAAESTRHGGVSTTPYASLNLGKNTDDAPASIAQNRALLCADLGIKWDQVAFGSQVHGNEVLAVTEPGRYDAGYDAFITNVQGVMVAITVADCTPILIYDPVQRACGAAHAGWRGAAAQIGTRTLAAMAGQYGTRASDCHVYIGTCISQAHFEVGPEVAAAFDQAYSRPALVAGKYFVDLQAAIKNEFMRAGVHELKVAGSTACTWIDNANYFSHRREQGKTGRFVVLIGMK
jgi:polyphenol oxidase